MKIPFRIPTALMPQKEKGQPDQQIGPPQHPECQPGPDYQTTPDAAPKPPPSLPLFFLLSHLADDGPVRIDGVKVGVCEVMGLEIDGPKLGAFAGALNALDFPLQLLVRQHPPGLSGMRDRLAGDRPDGLPEGTRRAAESLDRLLTDLESRDGIVDRRFYAVCAADRLDDLSGLLARAGLSVHPLRGRQLRMLLLASALGGSPGEMDEAESVEIEVGRREIRIGDRLVRSLHLGRWPRSLVPGFLQGLMAAGAPMDLSTHLGAIPAEQAARTLEWQKVRFESAQSLSLRRGKTMSPEAEIALEDVSRLRDEVQRGRERLFHASLSVTLHAGDPASLKEMTQRARAHFGATLGKLDALSFRQREGIVSGLPLGLNMVGAWRTLDTSSVARLFPFSPPDMDTPQRDAVRDRPSGVLARRLRPVRRDSPEREHGGSRPLRVRQVLLDQARGAAGPVSGCDGVRDRSRGRVRGHGARGRGEGAVPGRAGAGHEPVRDRRGRPGGAAPADREPSAAHRGDGGRAPERRAQGVARSLAGDVLLAAPRAHWIQGLLRIPHGGE